jgi:hypothetical protein
MRLKHVFAAIAMTVVLMPAGLRAEDYTPAHSSPEQRALMRTFYNTETLCREHAADDNPRAPSVCKDAMDINADIWRTLESVGLCYGDDRTSRSDWRWTKCGPHSLHPKPGGPFLMD